MRLWSLHPRYLDQQGLCGLWREAIMAKNALEQGEEHQYWNHPQLERFKNTDYPEVNIKDYLDVIYQESKERGYNFNLKYVGGGFCDKPRIPVSNSQIQFEIEHLRKKLEGRKEFKQAGQLNKEQIPDLHPLFYMINGPKADWEKGGDDD